MRLSFESRNNILFTLTFLVSTFLIQSQNVHYNLLRFWLTRGIPFFVCGLKSGSVETNFGWLAMTYVFCCNLKLEGVPLKSYYFYGDANILLKTFLFCRVSVFHFSFLLRQVGCCFFAAMFSHLCTQSPIKAITFFND